MIRAVSLATAGLAALAMGSVAAWGYFSNTVTTPQPISVGTVGQTCPSYPDVVKSTAGLRSYWRLGEKSGTTVMDSKGSTTGRYVGGVTLGVPGAIACDTAARYDGSSGYSTVGRQIQDDFSIEFWLQSSQTKLPTGTSLPTGGHWWDGAGLVDADSYASADDFGTALMGGPIGAGTGNRVNFLNDYSIFAGGRYNDGSWHHVVFTRTKSTGAMLLYVDAAQRSSGTGSKASLTGSPNPTPDMNFGRIRTADAIGGTYKHYYAGSLDEVAVYTVALPASQVCAHYKAAKPAATC